MSRAMAYSILFNSIYGKPNKQNMNEVIKQFNKDFKQSFVDESKPVKKRRFVIRYPKYGSKFYTHFIIEIINGYSSDNWYAVTMDGKIEIV